MIKKLFIFLFLVFLSACHSSPEHSAKKIAPLFDNLGNFHRPIQTQSPLAQRYFDQGLILMYSFEYGEAIRSFRAAITADPTCAMCHWGLSLALGSKTDMPLNGRELEDAKTELQLATQYVDRSNIVERLLVNALIHRYTNMTQQEMEEFAGLCSSYSQVSGSKAQNYANAMHDLTLFYPEDADIKTLYAAALFDVTEWNFWSAQHTPNPHTLEIIRTLESALKLDPKHPGANHLYVHVIEFSPYPTRALPNADQLHDLVPGSEHLAHMSCHIYFSVGQYHDATLANQLAISLYQNYVRDVEKQGFKPEIQYLYYHNLDYLTAAASMEGRKQLSISTADALAKEIYPFVEKNSFLQKMLTPSMLMLVRFGEWNKLLNFPQPDSRYQYAVGMWHYSHGLAALQLEQIDIALQDLAALEKIVQQGPAENSLGKMGNRLLKIALNIFKGVFANKTGETQKMIPYFNAAIAEQDAINSNDPPAWYFPTRQLLGTALLKAGKLQAAKDVFTEDLKRHPHNGWSLFGLAEAEKQLGNKEAAEKMFQEFKAAWKNADIEKPVYPLAN